MNHALYKSWGILLIFMRLVLIAAATETALMNVRGTTKMLMRMSDASIVL